MLDPWIHTLKILEPDYFAIKDIMEQEPYIKPVLKEISGKKICKICLEEVWFDSPNVLPNDRIYTSQNLDERINWASIELEKWQDVRRISWDSWIFPSTKLAEKFLTLYYITWEK
jgi:hypothetical protein